MAKPITALSAVLGLLCVSCATYSPPAEGVSATLVFQEDPATRAETQTLQAVQDEFCTGMFSARMVAARGLAFGNRSGPTPIEANRHLHLLAVSTAIGAVPNPMYPPASTGLIYCSNVSSFVPEVGHTYEAVHTAPGGNCRFTVRDAATGQEPASLVRHPVTKGCAAGAPAAPR